MEEYLSNYGHHISKKMYLWAVSMMRDRRGKEASPMSKENVDDYFRRYGVSIRHNVCYDAPYVLMMARMDYFGSSIQSEQSLAVYVQDYLDDVDGSPTRAFDELYINLVAKGIGIDWEDML